ncbi:MAG TPA: hypothetical protein VKQ11_00745 [Candidatus Sulfotelmatobacter sp.]|nr:hypothetical protein [Candidatus Sulfotelmatobacter sp.]
MLRKMFVPCVLLICATPLLSQNTPPAGSSPNAGRPMHGANAGACFQKAGLDKSVMGQLMSIQREAHSQIEGVCSNTSLTPQQKHQQVEEIHRQAHEKLGGLITPEQEKELMACRQQQQGGNQSGDGLLRMGGGCGERGRGGMGRGAGTGGAQNPTGSGNPSPSTQSSPQN